MSPWLYLRLWAKATPVVYRIGKRLRDSRADEKLCGAGTDLVVDGYPSSANSFLCELLWQVSPNIDLAHHTHSVANLKMGLKYDIPSVVPVRDPREAIPSRIARFGTDLNRSVEEYLAFHRFVKCRRDELIVFSFETVTCSPGVALRQVADGMDLAIRDVDPKTAAGDAKDAMKEWQQRHGDPENVSLPREDRDRKKRRIRDMLSDHPGAEEALDLHEDLTSGDSG
jgi:hypothetical protein